MEIFFARIREKKNFEKKKFLPLLLKKIFENFFIGFLHELGKKYFLEFFFAPPLLPLHTKKNWIFFIGFLNKLGKNNFLNCFLTLPLRCPTPSLRVPRPYC